jgi:chemotaxis family two-component system response regulator Rcp1
MKPTILVVDDNPTDLRLAREALEGTNDCAVEVAEDGEAALVRLRGEGRFADAARPALVVLDINMPKVDGLMVLSAIRSDPKLRLTPVVMVSSNNSGDSKDAAYDRSASCFVAKGFDFDAYQDQLRVIRDFWLNTNKLRDVGT